MTEKHYLKIISDLFRLTGYATGIIRGLIISTGESVTEDVLCQAMKYLEEQQKLILMQLEEKE